MSGKSSGNGGGDAISNGSAIADDGITIDTTIVDPVDSLENGGKRRGGWPKGKPRTGDRGDGAGSGTAKPTDARPARAKAEKVSLDLSGIEAALVGIHAGIAALTGNDVWAMPQDEASALAKATANVARHYPALAGHEKLIDWVMLIQAVGIAYGTRIYLTMPEKPKPESKPATVYPFNQAN